MGLKEIILSEKNNLRRPHNLLSHLHSSHKMTKLKKCGEISGCQRLGQWERVGRHMEEQTKEVMEESCV